MSDLPWLPIRTIPEDDKPKEIKFKNGQTCIAPGIARGPVEVGPDFDPGFTPTHWRPYEGDLTCPSP